MKINIKNQSNLPLKVIGEVLDKDLDSVCQIISYKNKQYKVEITKNILSFTVIVIELNIFSKDNKIKTNDLKFPKIPKKITKCYKKVLTII